MEKQQRKDYSEQQQHLTIISQTKDAPAAANTQHEVTQNGVRSSSQQQKQIKKRLVVTKLKSNIDTVSQNKQNAMNQQQSPIVVDNNNDNNNIDKKDAVARILIPTEKLFSRKKGSPSQIHQDAIVGGVTTPQGATQKQQQLLVKLNKELTSASKQQHNIGRNMERQVLQMGQSSLNEQAYEGNSFGINRTNSPSSSSRGSQRGSQRGAAKTAANNFIANLTENVTSVNK